ncbi:MAG: hypothetical protein ACI9XO_001032 [Paraglaciecola sp.]|jgi:hypothetical protein
MSKTSWEVIISILRTRIAKSRNQSVKLGGILKMKKMDTSLRNEKK